MPPLRVSSSSSFVGRKKASPIVVFSVAVAAVLGIFWTNSAVDGFAPPLAGLVSSLSSGTKPRRAGCGWLGTSASRRSGPRESIVASFRTTTSSLPAFLPPGGGGNKNNEWTELGTAAVTLLAGVAFFASPLGGLFFAVVNSFLALLILLPVGAWVAYTVWQTLYTTTGPCPQCGAPVRVLKEEDDDNNNNNNNKAQPQSPSLCFNCGAVVQAKNGKIYLANLNNNNSIMDNDNDNDDVNVFATWMEEYSSSSSSSAAKPPSSSKSKPTTIIDVEVKRDDS